MMSWMAVILGLIAVLPLISFSNSLTFKATIRTTRSRGQPLRLRSSSSSLYYYYYQQHPSLVRRTTCSSRNSIRRIASSSSLGPAATTIPDVSTSSSVVFDYVASNVTNCLCKSDIKRDKSLDGSSTGWLGWVDETSCQQLKSCLDSVCLSPAVKDQSMRWLQFLQSTPQPMILELSNELRETILKQQHQQQQQQLVETDHDLMISRVGCRLIVLPSGTCLSHNLQSPPGTMVFGTLLHGGVTRYRLIGSSSSNNKRRRRAGERRMIRETGTADTSPAPLESWLQYGGPERNYEAVDMGFCLVMETILLPKGLHLEDLVSEEGNNKDNSDEEHDMIMSTIDWDPHQFLTTSSSSVEIQQPAIAGTSNNNNSNETTTSQDDVPNICDLETSFCSTIGGLKPQIDEIVRRVMDGRVVRPVMISSTTTTTTGDDDDDDSTAASSSTMIDQIRREEMKSLLELGLEPVRGVLLYGPPGCGKTALAREISNILDARPPKIVAAPELLDRWVGGSERLIRELFDDAEQELKGCGGDPTKSALHVVVIDEIDAVFRKRTAAEASGEVTRASAVNQILAKLDGINSLDNVLLIGMTNRKELLDPALLRPGRLEVHIEIGLPGREGRREILQIHFNALRKSGRLSLPLCAAIDGVNNKTIDNASISDRPSRFLKRVVFPWKKRRRGSSVPSSLQYHTIEDLADDRWTGGFSGADIAGLVRCAGSIALARSRSQGDGGLDGLLITLEDVYQALEEVKQ